MATNKSALSSSIIGETEKPPTDLREVIQDLISIEDHEAASRRLLEKLVSFSSGAVDILEVGQIQLHLRQPDGSRHNFRIHPQGMEIDRETGLIYVTAVEIVEEPDKAHRRHGGHGKAHLFECDIEGKTLRSVNLTSGDDDEYHPSGMVLLNGNMYIALAQYLPETSATLVKFNVKEWSYEKLFRVRDHVGLVVPNLDNGEFFLGTWGSRHYYCTDLKGNIKSKHQNPCSDEMEHQDAQLIRGCVGADGDGTTMLATGVTANGMDYFGLEIIDIANWRVKVSLRWPSAQYITKGGWAPFANPTFLWVDSYDRVLALVTPDDEDEQRGKHAMLVLYTLTTRG